MNTNIHALHEVKLETAITINFVTQTQHEPSKMSGTKCLENLYDDAQASKVQNIKTWNAHVILNAGGVYGVDGNDGPDETSSTYARRKQNCTKKNLTKYDSLSFERFN